MRNFIKNRKWAFRLAVVGILVTSPFYITYQLFKEARSDIKWFYRDAWKAFKVGVLV